MGDHGMGTAGDIYGVDWVGEGGTRATRLLLVAIALILTLKKNLDPDIAMKF